MSTERVQKILAQAGIASRRGAEDLIREGQVTINGKVAQLGDKAEWGKDAIKVSGKLIHHVEEPIYIALYKPKGVISALVDPDGRSTLKDFLSKIHSRVFPVGRLDFNSEGLILLTNDGELAQQVQKSDLVPKVYQVKVRGQIDKEMLARIQRGAWVEKPIGDGSRTTKKKLKPHLAWIENTLQSKTQITVVVLGSSAFDIKLLFETTGFLVEKITRTAIGHIGLHGLAPGKYRVLKASQVQALISQPELGMRDLPSENPEFQERPAHSRQRTFESEDETEESQTSRPGKSSSFERGRGERPSFNRDRGQFGRPRQDRPGFSRGGEERTEGDRRERAPFNRERGSFGRGRNDDRPSFGRGRNDDRPSFGRGRNDDRPSFGRGRNDDRPSFGRGRNDDRPSFGRGRNDDRPSFGRGRNDDRPSFGRGRNDDRPSFGRGRNDDRPSFGRGRNDDRPSFGRGRNDDRPSFGRGRNDDRPSFNRDRKDRSSFDNRGSKPTFGRDRGERSSFGGPGERPRSPGKGFSRRSEGSSKFEGRKGSFRSDSRKPSGPGRPPRGPRGGRTRF
ncbi:MAG: pseudouridine synthase [Bdellovibrio sp.]|nr:pseudouridine synthase [Bdellovibrio sp.]